MTGTRVEIFWPASLPVEAATGAEEILRQAGIETACMVRPVRRGVDSYVYVLISTAVVQPFISTVFSRLAEDAYSGLRRFVHRLLGHPDEGADVRDAASGGSRPDGVVIECPAGTQLVFTHDLPAQAYQRAVDLDPAAGRWIWDPSGNRWTPVPSGPGSKERSHE
ncbi:hypothetical protein PUR71_38610 [Streptomyces sp. SP17BM10]|uniref:hypothetical protein n=1 Tax=Streptomyces sp. SP17BM10 TaxID=3002530 RepID=UPI002E7A64C3|nr:hypothetical protein [Streptomyces sp. SP17BM10]MEE1788772.1 hypothetical protein [Streptomyces sp. SP17BM10]